MVDRDDVRRLVEACDLVGLMEQDGHVLERAGSRFRLACPWHEERTPSCYLWADNHYHCYGCGAHGDAVSYLRDKRGLSFEQALEVLGHHPAPEQDRAKRQAKEDKRLKWLPVCPAPGGLEPTPGNLRHRYYGEPIAIWPYRDPRGAILMADVRYRDPKDPQKKAVITWSVCRHKDTGAIEWYPKPLPDPTPLYGLDRLAGKREVIISEGCKAADAGQQLLGDFANLTWRGGCKNLQPGKHDWSALGGKVVWVWPDADFDKAPCSRCEKRTPIPPGSAVDQVPCAACGGELKDERTNDGKQAALLVARYCLEAKAEAVYIIDVADYRRQQDGWDLADALDA